MSEKLKPPVDVAARMTTVPPGTAMEKFHLADTLTGAASQLSQYDHGELWKLHHQMKISELDGDASVFSRFRRKLTEYISECQITIRMAEATANHGLQIQDQISRHSHGFPDQPEWAVEMNRMLVTLVDENRKRQKEIDAVCEELKTLKARVVILFNNGVRLENQPDET